MSSSLSCKRSPLYHGAWIKDFIILNLILFSWLVSMRGGKIEKGEVCLVIQLLRMQIIKSCRCGDHYGAKSYVFASNLKDKLVVLVEGMSNDYVILSRKKIALSCFSQDCSFFSSHQLLHPHWCFWCFSQQFTLSLVQFYVCCLLIFAISVSCDMWINNLFCVFSKYLHFLWFVMSLLLAFLYFYQTRSKNLRVVTFFFPLNFCIAGITLCLLMSYSGADDHRIMELFRLEKTEV